MRNSYFKNILATALITLIITLSVWTFVSNPLWSQVRKSIPSSALMAMKSTSRVMEPGDHLQLLYHFWLAGEMISGQTPLFHNIYEFNTGDDAARRELGTYYAPFSIVHSIAAAGGQALGWNLTGIISIWLTAFFMWLLISRYTNDRWLRLLGTLIGIMFPYRWLTMFLGSPTGFAMTWIPMLWLGIDIALNDKRMIGGWMAKTD